MAFWRCAAHGLLNDEHTVEVLVNERGEPLPIPVKVCANCRRAVVPTKDPW